MGPQVRSISHFGVCKFAYIQMPNAACTKFQAAPRCVAYRTLGFASFAFSFAQSYHKVRAERSLHLQSWTVAPPLHSPQKQSPPCYESCIPRYLSLLNESGSFLFLPTSTLRKQAGFWGKYCNVHTRTQANTRLKRTHDTCFFLRAFDQPVSFPIQVLLASILQNFAGCVSAQENHFPSQRGPATAT